MKTYSANHCFYRVKENGMYSWINSILHGVKKGYNPKLLLFTLLLIFSIKPVCISAQPRFRITGKVTDATTGKPIYLANVFLANTTLGSTTNKSGLFVIKNVTYGNYELLVSMMGYEVEKKAVKIFSGTEREFNFELKPSVLQGEKVTITAKFPKEWRRNLKIFKRIYFGKSEFAGSCEFKNPEVLDFKYDRYSGQFKVIAEAPLVFLNHAFGYKVTIFLIKYEAKLFSNDDIYYIEGNEGTPQASRKNPLSYTSINQFEELIPKNKKQKENWEKNRQIAYNGSRRHFFKSLINKNLKKEGFKICGAEDFSGRSEYSINSNELLKKTENKNLFLLSFPDFLKVIYTKEKDEIQFNHGMQILERLSPNGVRYNDEANLRLRCLVQTSWMKIIEGKDILINNEGIVIRNGTKVGVVGYWGWDSPAESLPIDYKPDPNYIEK